MMRFFSSIVQKIDHWVTGLGTQEWTVIGAIVVVFSFVALRGFGKNSRL